MTADPPPQESQLVMLVRMEGKLDLLVHRMDDLQPRVAVLEQEHSHLALAVQGLEDQAKSRDAANAAAWKARDDTVEATARALAEAKVQQESTLAAETAKTERSWSPAAKLITALGVVVAVVSVLWAALSSIPNL